MSAGRGSRKNRQSSEEISSATAAGQTCTYADRICQRPIANHSNNLCWAHSKAAEGASKSRGKNSANLAPPVTSSQPSIEVAPLPRQELPDVEKLKRLSATYVAPVVETPGAQEKTDPRQESAAEKFDYLESLGSINVDDPTAPFVAMEDSASDDGSDEFASSAPLGRAGVYSAEEIVSLACDRMQRLRRLYVEELKQIGVQLKLSRRRYFSEVARDRRRRIGDPLADYVAVTPEQQQSRRVLLAMRHHRRRYPSAENVLRWSLRSKLRQLPLQSAVTNSQAGPNPGSEDQQQQRPESQAASASSMSRHCAVTSCEENSLPLTKYCTKHILLDRRQLLFSKCPGFVINDCEKTEERPLGLLTNGDVPSTPSTLLTLKSRQIECGRLAVQGPALPRGLASSTQSPTRTGNTPSPGSSSSPALCSLHRTLVLMSSPVASKPKK